MTVANPFPPGSLVQLKSGGPVMTVEDQPRTDGLVPAAWFNGAALERDVFHVQTVQAAAAPGKG